MDRADGIDRRPADGRTAPHDPVDRMLTLLPELVAALRDSDPHADARGRFHGPALTARQMTALVQLQLAGSQTMSDFAAGMGVSRATATEMVERLQERGLVERRHRDDDRRLVMVGLSETAAREASTVLRRRRHDIEQTLRRFPGIPAGVFADFLTELIRRFKEE